MTQLLILGMRFLFMLLGLYLMLKIFQLSGVSIWSLYDPASLIPLFAACCYLLVAFHPRDLGYALADALLPANAELRSRYAVSAYIWRASGRYLIAFSLIAFFLGIVQGMGNLDDTGAFGASIALALLPLFYTMIPVLLICLPTHLRLQSQALRPASQAEFSAEPELNS